MPVDQILSLLIAERDKLTKAIELLQGTSRTATPRKKVTATLGDEPTTKRAGKGRRWTAAMKRAAAERAKAVWVRRRKAAKKG